MNKSALLLTLLLTGCAAVPEPPAKDLTPDIPKSWHQNALTGQSVLAQQHWWQAFHDPTLNHLIESVLEKNNDLAIATLKVRQARYAARLTDTNQTPDVSASASGSRQRSKEFNYDGENPTTSAKYGYSTTYSSALSLTYDVDLWGTLRDQRLSSQLEAAATEEDRATTALSLIGTTATLYWEGIYLNQLVKINQASLAYSEKSLSIATAKYTAGHG